MNCINLPFFGLGDQPIILPHKYTFNVDDLIYKRDYTGAGAVECLDKPRVQGDDEAGYWDNDTLLAMLEAYKKHIPGFTFRRCRRGFAVPCPGNPKLGGWPDGAKHSTSDRLVSHEALVFIRNGWPKFRCVHAHCEQPKKTINDWRDYFDPGFVLFDVAEWLDAYMEGLSNG